MGYELVRQKMSVGAVVFRNSVFRNSASTNLFFSAAAELLAARLSLIRLLAWH